VPDPALGSAGVSGRQAAYAGSDREVRGQVLRALASGPATLRVLAGVAGLADDPVRMERIVAGLVADGLVVGGDGGLRLP
jgi:A/G-specific adenine glycosylase